MMKNGRPADGCYYTAFYYEDRVSDSNIDLIYGPGYVYPENEGISVQVNKENR